jgi:hypothetical protein
MVGNKIQDSYSFILFITQTGNLKTVENIKKTGVH